MDLGFPEFKRYVKHLDSQLSTGLLKECPTAKSFQEAIKLGPAAPLPRLGLGLAKIKRGDLEAGRREIDIAVGLDSANALLRSYLGKAYFEEKRSPLDAQQLAIAKELVEGI